LQHHPVSCEQTISRNNWMDLRIILDDTLLRRSNVKIAAVSDLHGNYPVMPELHDQNIDLLLVCGDITGNKIHQDKHLNQFIQWVKNINPKMCLFTQGNHDYFRYEDQKNIKQLIDQSYDFEGLIVYGTPWTPEFCGWNWMKEDKYLDRYFDNINNYTNILMSHGPMRGVCDSIYGIGESLGSRSLRNAVNQRSIDYVFSGHIHSANHNWELFNNTKCCCVSLLNEQYQIAYKPREIEI
jgi:Icc-related predicted phosphoesterase